MIRFVGGAVAVILALGAGASRAAAAISPLGLSAAAPVQVPPSDFSVIGARTSLLWGNHRDVYGVDLGALGNITQGSFGGIAVSGLFNWNQGTATVVGLQFAGVTNVNINQSRILGLQASLVNVNAAESSLVGAGLGLTNHSPHQSVYGVQLSLYNRAREVYGFQVGLFNVTESLHGIQIGLLNFNTHGLFAVAPLINVGF